MKHTKKPMKGWARVKPDGTIRAYCAYNGISWQLAIFPTRADARVFMSQLPWLDSGDRLVRVEVRET